MKVVSNTFRCRLGFSLAEVLAALIIGAMVLVAVLCIYSRAENTAAAITRKLNSSQLGSEVLQRIAEDLDGIVAAGSDTKITIRNKFDNLYPAARLEILKTIYDKSNKAETFEEIIWQSSYDYDTDGLVLYRSYRGMGVEDKLLDEGKENWEKKLFVPICEGATFFRILVPRGEDFQDKWTTSSLPRGIVVTISFAEPFKTVTGELDVPDEEKITRTIAIDRTRKIKFTIVKKEEVEAEKGKKEEDKKDKEETEENKEESNEEQKPR